LSTGSPRRQGQQNENSGCQNGGFLVALSHFCSFRLGLLDWI
jgi:hypothetical protein